MTLGNLLHSHLICLLSYGRSWRLCRAGARYPKAVWIRVCAAETPDSDANVPCPPSPHPSSLKPRSRGRTGCRTTQGYWTMLQRSPGRIARCAPALWLLTCADFVPVAHLVLYSQSAGAMSRKAIMSIFWTRASHCPRPANRVSQRLSTVGCPQLITHPLRLTRSATRTRKLFLSPHLLALHVHRASTKRSRVA